MSHPGAGGAFALLPETEARARLAGRDLCLRVLRPPYPALGIGVLRVLRVAERGALTELVAGYDRYERLTGERRPATP